MNGPQRQIEYGQDTSDEEEYDNESYSYEKTSDRTDDEMIPPRPLRNDSMPVFNNETLREWIIEFKLGHIPRNYPRIGLWDVSNVTNMKNLFKNLKKFNQPLDGWNVSKVRNMEGMFSGCTKFNQPLDSWNLNV